MTEQGRTPAATDGGASPSPAAVEPAGSRPLAPACTPQAVESLWDALVAAMPAGYFHRQHHEMLLMYCTHSVEWDSLAHGMQKLRNQSGDGQGMDWDQLAQLSTMRDRERRCFADLATKLQLTPQSVRAEKGKGKGAAPGTPPWQQ